MPAITNTTIGTDWTTVNTGPVNSIPPTLWNASGIAILVRFGGAGDEHSIADGLGLKLEVAGQQCEAKAASEVDLQALRGVTPV